MCVPHLYPFICRWTSRWFSAAVNIGVHMSVLIRIFVFSGYTPRSGTAGSYGDSSFFFSKGPKLT